MKKLCITLAGLLLCLSASAQGIDDTGCRWWPRRLPWYVVKQYLVYGRDYPVHAKKCLDMFGPEEGRMVEELTSCDTLLAAYWRVRFMGEEIYPTVIGYKSEDCVLFRTESLERSFDFFSRHPDEDMYEDDEIRVFVKRR